MFLALQNNSSRLQSERAKTGTGSIVEVIQ
jgi:hypothetical protein